MKYIKNLQHFCIIVHEIFNFHNEINLFRFKIIFQNKSLHTTKIYKASTILKINNLNYLAYSY